MLCKVSVGIGENGAKCGDTKFAMPVRHPEGDVGQTVGCISWRAKQKVGLVKKQ